MNQTTSQKNFRIAAGIERAEKALAVLIERDIAIANVVIGVYPAPLIQVHYSEACKAIQGHGFCQARDRVRGVMITRAALDECLVQWEEPIAPVINHHSLRAVH